MGRYRKIDPRIWIDDDFASLSHVEKLVALYVLTAQSNRIGLFIFSPGRGAEDLHMVSAQFVKAFKRCLDVFGWQWDEQARVLYLDTWWRYNQPENDNNLIGNLKDLHEVPTTPLFQLFSTNLEYLEDRFHRTFTQTLAERYPQRSPKRSGTQEQDQEQEQEQIKTPLPPKGGAAVSSSLNGHGESFGIFWKAYPKKRGKGQAEKAWLKIKPDDVLVGVMLGKIERAKQTPDWTKDGGRYIPHPATWLNGRHWEDEELLPVNGRAEPALCTNRVKRDGQSFLRTCQKPAVGHDGRGHPLCAECLSPTAPVAAAEVPT